MISLKELCLHRANLLAIVDPKRWKSRMFNSACKGLGTFKWQGLVPRIPAPRKDLDFQTHTELASGPSLKQSSQPPKEKSPIDISFFLFVVIAHKYPQKAIIKATSTQRLWNRQ
jgi:hypothetical protein